MSKSPVMRNEQATRLDIKDRLARRVVSALATKPAPSPVVPSSLTVTFRTFGGK